mgnify:CR=1 FL=1
MDNKQHLHFIFVAMKLFIYIIGLLTFSIVAGAQHTVVLKTGEKLNGVVLMIRNDTLHFAINRNLNYINMKSVSSIFFDEFVPYDGALLLDDEVQTITSDDYIIKYQMKDRKMTNPPKISIGTEDKGTVVVEVTINRTGVVMNAIPGITGSTTSNEYLLTKAKFAAQGSRFEQAPLAPVEQKGTIIISY